MEVLLPASGAKATLRDKLSADDRFAVQDAIRLSLDTSTGLQETAGGMVNAMRNALLARVIESWTVEGLSVPSEDPKALGQLDIDDYNALEDAVEPLMAKIIRGIPNRSRQPSS